MKKLVILFSVLFMLGMVYHAEAQLSRKEKKEWKKKKKKTSPSQFKSMQDELNSLKGRVSGLDGQVSSLQARISDKDAKISELTDEIRNLESELANARAEAEKAKQMAAQAATSAPEEVVDESGVVFKVQIGAFRNKDLSEYFDNNENFGGEVTEDGTQKITLGSFRDYWKADEFKKYLREMGVHDAWIVPYKDGERVSMKDVLEGVL